MDGNIACRERLSPGARRRVSRAIDIRRATRSAMCAASAAAARAAAATRWSPTTGARSSGRSRNMSAWRATSTSRTASARRSATAQLPRRVLTAPAGAAPRDRRAALAHAVAHRDRDLAPRPARGVRYMPNGIDLPRFAAPARDGGRRPGDRHRRRAARREEPCSPAARRFALVRLDAPGAPGDRRRRAGARRRWRRWPRTLGVAARGDLRRPHGGAAAGLSRLRRVRAVLGHRADADVGAGGDGGGAAGRGDRRRRHRRDAGRRTTAISSRRPTTPRWPARWFRCCAGRRCATPSAPPTAAARSASSTRRRWCAPTRPCSARPPEPHGGRSNAVIARPGSAPGSAPCGMSGIGRRPTRRDCAFVCAAIVAGCVSMRRFASSAIRIR